MNIYNINTSTSSVVNMVNQKVQASAVTQANRQNKAMQMFKAEAFKSNYNEDYFNQNSDFSPADGTNISDWPQKDIITDSVNRQMSSAENVLEYLQDLSNKARLELKYEQLIAAGSADAAQQTKNENAYKFYHETTNSDLLDANLSLHKGFSFINFYNSFTDGNAGKATNLILNDVTSLKYLGLENIDNMNAQQRIDAFDEAVKRVSSRIKETPWKTNVTVQAPTQAQLDKLDQKYSAKYKEIKFVYFDAVKELEGSSIIRIQDIKNGSYTPPKIISPPVETVRSVYDLTTKWWLDT